jgi:hypothetical protein
VRESGRAVAIHKKPTEHRARNEAAHVSPKRHSADILGQGEGKRAAENLTDDPESQIRQGGNLDEQRQEKKRHENDHAGTGKEKEIRAENPRDRAGGSHGGQARIRISKKMHQPCHQTANKIERKKAQRTHPIYRYHRV